MICSQKLEFKVCFAACSHACPGKVGKRMQRKQRMLFSMSQGLGRASSSRSSHKRGANCCISGPPPTGMLSTRLRQGSNNQRGSDAQGEQEVGLWHQWLHSKQQVPCQRAWLLMGPLSPTGAPSSCQSCRGLQSLPGLNFEPNNDWLQPHIRPGKCQWELHHHV